MKMMEQPPAGGQSQVVVMDGKEVSALEDVLRRGARQMLLDATEAELSWTEVLEDLKSRGLGGCPSWPWATGRWASGRPCAKCFRPRASSAAGCTRPLEHFKIL
jgi:hypothetical protein